MSVDLERTLRRSDGLGEWFMKQLCNELREFAVEVRQLGYEPEAVGVERKCLDLSERMLGAVNRAEARLAAKPLAVQGAYARS